MRRVTFVALAGLITSLALIAGASARATSLAPAALASAPNDSRALRLLAALSANTRFITAVEGDVDKDGDDLDVVATKNIGKHAWSNVQTAAPSHGSRVQTLPVTDVEELGRPFAPRPGRGPPTLPVLS